MTIAVKSKIEQNITIFFLFTKARVKIFLRVLYYYVIYKNSYSNFVHGKVIRYVYSQYNYNSQVLGAVR